jgi:hypothetical protein
MGEFSGFWEVTLSFRFWQDPHLHIYPPTPSLHLILSLHHPPAMHKFKPASDHPADEDPLTKALAPPPDESPKEREIRLAEEAAAQRRSDAIDEELNRQRLAEKRAPKCIRILLLGPVPISFCPLPLFTRVSRRPKRIWYVPLFAALFQCLTVLKANQRL